MPKQTKDGWELIPPVLAARMRERGASKNKIVRKGKVGWETIGSLLDGEPVKREDAMWRVADYLGWRRDAFDRIRQGLAPVEADANRSESPGSADLRDLLGVGGQVVEDRLTAIEDRLDRLEGHGNVTPIRPDTDDTWFYAASRDDGQPATNPTTGPTVSRPSPPDDGPDPTIFFED